MILQKYEKPIVAQTKKLKETLSNTSTSLKSLREAVGVSKKVIKQETEPLRSAMSFMNPTKASA